MKLRPGHAILKGIPISLEQRVDVLADVGKRVAERSPGGYVAITNTESMYHALRRPRHMQYIQGADHSLCDGVGVIAAGWFWGLRIKRYNGPVFMLDCIEASNTRGWRHFFYGGKEGVAEEMAARLKSRYPGMHCVGTYSPPFRTLNPEEDDAVTEMINAAKPDIVWVGLGLIKQEEWIADHLGKLNAPWLVGVGAAFDYHSGAVPWAPPLLRGLGLEWLFRLIIQPRIRARRYWWSLVFVVQAAWTGLVGAKFLRHGSASREAA